MKHRSFILPPPFTIIAILVFLYLTSSVAMASFADFQTRPGTINHTLTLCDGAEVVLDSVVIRYVSSPYIYVSDPWDVSNTIPVYANVDLKPWLAAEITGRTATIGGKRIVIASRVRLYTDCRGRPFYMLPKFRVPLLWDWMLDVPLGDMPKNIPPPSDMESMQSMQASMSGVLWTPDSGVLPEDPITLGSVDGVIVTADETDFTDDTFYVEDPNRAFGWKVVYTGATDIDRGDKVTVTGDVLIDDNQEAYIDATSVTIIGTGEVAPLGMIGKVLGGADMDYKPGVNYPVGHGLYNKGLLARSCGKVTYVDQTGKYFYMDDGSGLDDGNANGALGVKVSWDEQAVSTGNPAIIAPQEDWFVSVTGISSSENPQDDDVIRVLRPRRQEDVQVQNPSDDSHPYVTITNPSGNELHIASGQTTAQLSGTATDPDTGIISVQIGFTATGVETPPTAWNNAGYNSVTHVWTYDWQSPQTQRVWVKATDFSMHTTTIYRDVTVSSVTVIYVKPNGSDGNNGSTWELAKATVQAGLNAAVSSNEVWVADGTYQENVTLTDGVRLYGGFIVNDTYREQRDWNVNETILEGNGTVVTSPEGATETTVIDGFTICSNQSGIGIYFFASSPTISNNTITNNWGGGIYYDSDLYSPSSPVITNNTITGTTGSGIHCGGGAPTIMNNTITDNIADNKGGGIYCDNSSPTIANNIIADNVANSGGGIYCSYSPAVIVNNTIVGNSGNGISCSSSSPTIANNIVAFNSFYGISGLGGAPTLRNNCVYNSNGYNYSGLPPGTGDIQVDPKLVGVHIRADSPCRDAGNNSFVQPGWIDMDGQPRILPIAGMVDMGADEITDCIRYAITLTPEVSHADINTPIKITVHVHDVIPDQPVPDVHVDFTIDTGELLSISPGGYIDESHTSGYGITDDVEGNIGNVEAYITRHDQGYVNIVANATLSGCESFISDTTKMWFGIWPPPPPVYLVFLIDVTGSTEQREAAIKSGINATVDYLYEQLQLQGREFHVAGIKFSNSYQPNLLDPSLINSYGEFFNFTTNMASFESWVNQDFIGGDREYQLDILMFAKDLVPEAIPGLYIALATDEDSDSSLNIQQVAAALTQSYSIVFIDPGRLYDSGHNPPTDLVDYYDDLAVNGGAVEETSIGTFTFPLMRQAILGQ